MSNFRQVQQNLSAAGFNPGAIDGLWGPSTLTALMGFASDRHDLEAMRPRAVPLAAEVQKALITTPLTIAHFVATLAVESQGFRRIEEDLHYTTPSRLDAVFSNVHGLEDAAALIQAGDVAIANLVYANRSGNGDEASGDGWRYRGRTEGQLTGRDNYRDMGKRLGLPLEVNPDLALNAATSARIVCRFWSDKGLNRFAAADDAEGIRARWNGPGLVGLANTRRIAARIMTLFQKGA